MEEEGRQSGHKFTFSNAQRCVLSAGLLQRSGWQKGTDHLSVDREEEEGDSEGREVERMGQTLDREVNFLPIALITTTDVLGLLPRLSLLLLVVRT